jgi:hypothetical protein
MSDERFPPDYAAIDELLEAGDVEGAREMLAHTPASNEGYAVLRIKLGLREGSLEPGPAMQRLIALMRRNSDWPGAKELYQEASQAAYQSRQSSVSHSHPPPPVKSKSDKDD